MRHGARTVVLVTRGTGGDIRPFLCLGAELRRRGHDVLLVSHCGHATLARAAGLAFEALDSPEEFARFIADGPLLDTLDGWATFFERHLVASFDREYALLRRCCARPDCIIVWRWLSSVAAPFVAERLDVPALPLFISVAQAETTGLVDGFFSRKMSGAMQDLRRRAGLSTHAAADYAPRPGPRSLAAWPDWFVPPRGWPDGLTPTGFLIHADHGECPDALTPLFEGSIKPILISGGTAVWTRVKDFYRTAVTAVALLGRPAIVVTRRRDLLDDTLPPGIVWQEYLPIGTILRHVDGVLHHGGLSILAEALEAGVPQMVLPSGADRPDTARRLCALGGADMLPPPQWQPHLVASRLSTLLSDAAVRRTCDDLAQRMIDNRAAASRAAVIIEELRRPSPAAWGAS